MRLTVDNDVFKFYCAKKDKDIPKSNGFRFNPDNWNNPHWWTDDASKVEELIQELEENQIDKYVKEKIEEDKNKDINFFYFKNNKYIFKCKKEYRFPAKEAGFKFEKDNWKNPHWWTNDYRNAEILLKNLPERTQVDKHVKEKIEEDKKREEEEINKSKKKNSNISIPAPKNLDYLPFQKAGIEYSLNRNNTLIADSMGLGKTVESIGYINYNKPKNVIIVVPASLRLNWKKELNNWLTENYSISVINGKENKFNSDIVIISYALVNKHKDKLKKNHDLLILDESHKIKNYKSKRSKSVEEISKYSKNKLFLTGTPVMNRPNELFNQLKILNSSLTNKGFIYYAKKFCDGKQEKHGFDASGASNLDELNRKLRKELMLRRTKDEVLNELPDKRRDIITLNKNSKVKEAIKEEEKVQNKFNKYKNKLEKIKKQQDNTTKEENKKQLEEKAKSLKSEMSGELGEIAKARHNTALAKVPNVNSFIEESLELEDKLVIFTHHKDVLEKIYDKFSDISVKYHGGMNNEKKEESIEEFQKGNARLFIATTQSAGTGITLTASSTVIFAELEWTPSDMNQAEDRCHRITQKDSVNVYHLVVNDSIDASLSKTLIEKQKIIDKVMK